MGQVPTHHYLLIGSGAMARHISFYLASLQDPNIKISEWNRKSNSLKDLEYKLSHCTHVLLAISDTAIFDFFNTFKRFSSSQSKWIHFSGAHHFADMISVHPLMSFGPELYDLKVYEKIHFVITGVNSLAEIFPFFRHSFTVLSPEKKSLYHSLCVLGGNLPILLWDKMNQGLKQMGLPEDATDVYLQVVLKNYLDHREKALTGPLKRKDITTIKNNLSALQNDSFQKIYSAFAESQNINTRDL